MIYVLHNKYLWVYHTSAIDRTLPRPLSRCTPLPLFPEGADSLTGRSVVELCDSRYQELISKFILNFYEQVGTIKQIHPKIKQEVHPNFHPYHDYTVRLPIKPRTDRNLQSLAWQGKQIFIIFLKTSRVTKLKY